MLNGFNNLEVIRDLLGKHFNSNERKKPYSNELKTDGQENQVHKYSLLWKHHNNRKEER